MAKIESIYTRRIADLEHAARLKDIRVNELEGLLAIQTKFANNLTAIFSSEVRVRPSAFDVSHKDK